jgi:hypothetical protein
MLAGGNVSHVMFTVSIWCMKGGLFVRVHVQRSNRVSFQHLFIDLFKVYSFRIKETSLFRYC